MQDRIFIAQVRFYETAKDFFNFPITSSIRLSFWIENQNVSTFSEVKIGGKNIKIDTVENVEIKIIDRSFLADKIFINNTFFLGIYPNAFAVGKILSIKS
jgi:hypothetical protein